ncbi:MAG: sensor histidine kinase [Chitinophagales bacterium]
MKKLRWLGILMMVTILGIAGFQIFWLKQTYDREEKNLSFKTETAFITTVRNLQGSKIKLERIFSDSLPHGKKIVISSGGMDQPNGDRMYPRQNIVTTINVLQDKIRDSLEKKGAKRPGVVISFDKSSFSYKHDSAMLNPELSGQALRSKTRDLMFRFMADVDSLQDTLKVKEISIAYTTALKNQKTVVPFTVLRLDTSVLSPEGPGSNEITLGFAHPITYKMQLGNTVPYLLKQIASPIIFSFFLVGATVLSFLLLYRSLLRQRRLAVLKNEFISNITHELKTPIATVGVAIEALKNFNAIHDPQRTKEYLDISSNELQRLSLLVDKVLKLSMFEKKEIDLKYETLNLKGVVDEVVTSMRLQLEKYHARVSVTANGDVNLQGDRLHLLSVVFNLLDNALKYSKGEPSIQVDLKEQEKNVVLSITDNGIGIAPEYKDKMFEKFFRAPTGDTHNAKGYGLGLSYVAHVIQKHRGTISVESQPGIGSKFVITLPKQQT